MKVTTILLTLSFSLLSATFILGQASSQKISLDAHWSVGQDFKFHVEHKTIVQDSIDGNSRDSIGYGGVLSVVDSSSDTYTLSFYPYMMSMPDMLKGFEEVLDNFPLEPLVFQTTHSGEFIGFENKEAVTNSTSLLADSLLEAFGHYKRMSEKQISLLKHNRHKDVTDDLLKYTLFSNYTYFFGLLGGDYYTDSVLVYQDKIAHADGALLNCDRRFRLKEFDSSISGALFVSDYWVKDDDVFRDAALAHLVEEGYPSGGLRKEFAKAKFSYEGKVESAVNTQFGFIKKVAVQKRFTGNTPTHRYERLDYIIIDVIDGI